MTLVLGYEPWENRGVTLQHGGVVSMLNALISSLLSLKEKCLEEMHSGKPLYSCSYS